MRPKRSEHPEADATILGAARDVGPIVRLGYGSLRRTISGHSPVIVADNGCDAEAVAFLSAQDWIRLVPLAERVAASRAEYEASVEALASMWEKVGAIETAMGTRERQVLDELRLRIRAEPPPPIEDLAQLGQTIDWLLPQVTTRYAVLIDSDVEFNHLGWLSDIVTLMDDRRIDLLGFVEPTPHPIAERFATFVLAMRTAEIRSLRCSFATQLDFADDDEAARWHAQSHGRFLDTTAFDDFPTARFYDTAARVYEAALAEGLACQEFPAQWRERFIHLGHMAWSGRVDDSYTGANDLRDHRRKALDYAQTRCAALGIGELR
jgi:hypothetical protein